MKRFKEIITTKTIDLDTMKEDITTTDKTYVTKNWSELTREQKEVQIENHGESIMYDYQEMLYDSWECDLDNLKHDIKEISFDDIYLDSNSQGAWIDYIKNFRVYFPTIEVYGETVELRDVDYTIRRYIENVEEKDLWFNQSYIECETWEKIIKTKKFKNWVQDILTVVNKWIDLVNSYATEMIDNEYYSPYNLDNECDADYLDNWFSDMEFTYEIVDNEEREV